MRPSPPTPWRVIYIARGEKQARAIEEMLSQAGFYAEIHPLSHGDSRAEDIEIRVLESEAGEARLYLMERGL